MAACENNENKCDANDLEVAKISLSNGDGDTGELDAAAPPQPPLPHNEEEQSFKKQKVSGNTKKRGKVAVGQGTFFYSLFSSYMEHMNREQGTGHRALRSITCTES